MLEHTPFVPPEKTMRELTFRAVAIGALLGLVFAASSVYLGLKVGLTVSASIPVAVLSITVFRWLGMKGTILENNIAQTTGSAGESIAAGVAFTLPSLLLMGFDLEFTRILLVGLLGGLVGVLMMIPLRNGLIVKEHGKLAYPEGTACADVLIAGEKGGTEAVMVFTGFFVGLGYAFLNLIAKLWGDVSAFAIKVGGLSKAMIGFEVSPPMLGVGYIIGPRVAANMLGGGLLAFVVLIPLIAAFGGEAVAGMSASKIRNEYILYIGAGAVATGGFIALARAIPTIISAFRSGLKSMGGGAAAAARVPRTERDLPMSVVLIGAGAIALTIWIAPILQINLVTALLVVLFGFFFVTVSSRITGEIGSSSNPISGMTIATLLLTCGLFVALGWVGVGYKEMALTTAALVCVAASNGGTISQDLKTGFLVGATPRSQQLSIFVGVVTSAILIGGTLLLLNNSNTTYPAVSYPGVTLKGSDQFADGPDGKTYRIAYLADEVMAPTPAGQPDAKPTPLPRGKYLVNDKNEPVYRADPGVSGSYPYRLIKADGKVTPEAMAASKETDLGVDHRVYRVVENGTQRLLVGEDGQVAYTSRHADKFDAPKAQLFRLIIDGTLGGELPWHLVMAGVFIAIILELLGVSSLPFAVGLYLPIYTSGGIFVGGFVRWLVDRKRKSNPAEAEFSPGMLMASGLIAGGAIAGVVQALLIASGADQAINLEGLVPSFLAGSTEYQWWPMVPFVAMAAALYYIGARWKAAAPLPTARVIAPDEPDQK
jgi:putative OPT family oligopeptide transporter